jgi:hypothetical protein
VNSKDSSIKAKVDFPWKFEGHHESGGENPVVETVSKTVVLSN